MSAMEFLPQRGIAQLFLVIILLAGIVISVLLIQTRTNLFPKAAIYGATLSLSPSQGSFNPGCDFSIDANLDTGGFDTDGTDVVLIFNPAVFEGISAQNGSLYPNYPAVSIDNTNGKIRYSGLASPSSPFNGAGKFATFNFKVKPNAQTGNATISFDFDPNNPSKTTDSNVIETATIQERLSSVVNGGFQIGSGSCDGSSPSAGDINGDSKVDFNDLEELKKYLGFKVMNVQKSDLNSDGVVDNTDLGILSGLLNIPSPTPTPAATPVPSANPLKITNISNSGLAQTSAIIKWKTNYPGTSRVSYGKTQTNLNLSTILDANLVSVHQANLTGLAKNTKYYYKVHSKNTAGVEFSSTVKNFTTRR